MSKEVQLPHPESCRPEKIASSVYECKVEQAISCPFAINFGSGHYCKHPKRDVAEVHSVNLQEYESVV